MIKYQIAGLSDVGIARQNNEDSLISFNSPNGQVVVVCDGMGGENGGETASNMAVSIIQDILTSNQFSSPDEAITGAVNAANQGVVRKATLTPSLAGMGSTCVIAIIKDGIIHYGSVGDSRIYYYQPQQGLRQITHDQSYVQTLVDSGEITAEEAEHHPRKNEILNAVGLENMSPAVIGEPISPVPGSCLLLCSDGLTGMVSDSMIQHVLSRADLSPEQKAQKLVSLANEAGGLDNITVQVVAFDTATADRMGSMHTQADTDIPLPADINGGSTRNLRKLITIAACVIILLGGGCAYYFMQQKKAKERAEKEKVEQVVKQKEKEAQKTEKNKTPKGTQQPAPKKNVPSINKASTDNSVHSTTANQVKEKVGNQNGRKPKDKNILENIEKAQEEKTKEKEEEADILKSIER